ncbi:MAG: YifB family Mg chelatase-like AAA ATPase [Elusimicrobiales bacterium]
MLAKVVSLGFRGIDGFKVEVEVDVTPGLPSFTIVGLPDTNIKEARDRVISAIKNSGFKIPHYRIVVNLSPAEIKKTGTHYDLPIAVGILLAINPRLSNTDISQIAFLGELALDGRIRGVAGVLPMLISAKENSYCRKVIVPYDNSLESHFSGIDYLCASNLRNVFLYLKGEVELEKPDIKNHTVRDETDEDFSDVKGQYYAKRACEVAVSGFHNMIMIGPPGSGKSMIARRIPTIMPPMSETEILETTKIYSVVGLNKNGIITKRPFRDPHHTISDVALIGGGAVPRPGEISLAHNGVLFLDEFAEFSRSAIEAMRQPLETRQVTVSRVKETITFPARFMLVASANPCPCGYLGHPSKPCICTPIQIAKYRAKFSGPILDRIDIHIEMVPVKYDEWKGDEKKTESSSDIYERIKNAIEIQIKRFGGKKFNSEMNASELKRYCIIDDESSKLIENAMDKLGYSARSIDKILKVARTIADLDGAKNITKKHIVEALHYRILDKNMNMEGYDSD